MQRPFDQVLEKLKGLRTQFSESWNVQATAILLLVGCAALAFVAVQKRDSKDSLTILFAARNLTPSQMERIEAALGEALLSDYVVDNGAIRVPAEKRGQYLSVILEAKALPQTFHSPTQEAIDNASLIETSRIRSQRLHFALEKEARLAICELPGVLDASVHIDVATDRSIRMQTQTTAVVGVKTSPESPLDEQAFRMIQAMLVNFKAGLTADAVTITDLTTRNFFRGSMDSQPPEALASLRKADLERAWRQKLAAAISFAPEAQLAVRVIPTEDGRAAQSVYCSVSVPRDSTADELATTNAQTETAVRHRIRSALLPLIPQENENANLDEIIAVTVFDREVTAEAFAPASWLSHSSNLLAVTLLGIAGVMALFLLKSPSRPRVAEEMAPSLRIYEGQEAYGAAEFGVAPSEHLRAIVADDPDAVAESLSDFIDRAS